MKRNPMIALAVVASLILFAASCFVDAALPALADRRTGTIDADEKLVFNIYWGFFKVGEALMAALPDADVDGHASRHFRLTIRTTGWVDAVYKVRTRIDTFVDPETTRSIYYEKKAMEGGVTRDDRLVFDWENLRVSYFSHGEHRQDTDILAGTFDPLGILYYARTQDYRSAKTIRRPVTDGKACIVGQIISIRKEQLTLNGSVHDTTVIQARLEGVDGLFEESRGSQFTLWFNNDPARTPLKINIDVFIGGINCELISPLE